jgi:two-component system, NtrC family, sensor kinase
MARTTINVLLTCVAVALLGVLVLLSTASNDAQRRLDLSLRHVSDVVQSVERELVNMRNLNIDSRDRLAALSETLDGALRQAANDLALGYPPKPNFLQAMRSRIMRGFNSIGAGEVSAIPPERMSRDFAALLRQADRLRYQIAGFAEHYGQFQTLSDAATHDSREYVRELRERRLIESADAIFRASQQILQRTDRGAPAEMQQVDAIIARLQQDSELRAQDDRERLEQITDQLASLVPARRELDASFDAVVNVQLARPLDALRDQINREYLYHLSTVNESRVLLNVYTSLLLLVLGYFGFRLQRSYGALNQSHAQLATVNTSLEERVRQRTIDLESAYNELKESQVQLVQAEKMSSLGQLVAGVMHEINTPLLYVLNNQTTTAASVTELKSCVVQAAKVVDVLKTPGATTETLKQELMLLRSSVEDNAALEAIEEIEGLAQDNTEGLQQISELVQSLKDFSRLDRAGEDRFDVREGIEKTLTITHNLWKHGIEVDKQFEEVPEILCAPSKINQVFINLVTNAVQAMDGKGTLTLRTRNLATWIEVDVEDTGCGIPEENLAKIMDPFFTTKPVGQGTGLGMSIVSKIIEEHGGSISVQSEPGVGSKFTIRLPVSPRSAAQAA